MEINKSDLIFFTCQYINIYAIMYFEILGNLLHLNLPST